MTLRQHVFPRAAIKRFCNDKNEVSVFTAGHPKEPGYRVRPKCKGPDASIFITQRAWDEHTEHAIMEPIEVAYQTVADRFMTFGVDVRTRELSADDSQAVTDFYGLWQIRAWFRYASLEPVEFPTFAPDAAITPALHEIAEKMGVITAPFVGPNGFAAVAARQMHGAQILHGMNFYRFKWGIVAWACITLPEANFIVPDEFAKYPYLPLSPTRCFIALRNAPLPLHAGKPQNPPFHSITAPTLSAIAETNAVDLATAWNRTAQAQAKHYYFQRPLV